MLIGTKLATIYCSECLGEKCREQLRSYSSQTNVKSTKCSSSRSRKNCGILHTLPCPSSYLTYCGETRKKPHTLAILLWDRIKREDLESMFWLVWRGCLKDWNLSCLTQNTDRSGAIFWKPLKTESITVAY